MDREPEILKDRIEVPAFERRLRDPKERIRGDKYKELERRCDPGLDAEHGRLEGRGNIAAEHRDERAEQ